MWKWTFCEEWQILGGIVESQDQLAKWATLIHKTREIEHPREVAREEFGLAQAKGLSTYLLVADLGRRRGDPYGERHERRSTADGCTD